MGKKHELIREVFIKNNTNFYDNVVLFTKGFKAVGEFYNDHNVEGVIALKNAKIHFYASNCECETNPSTQVIPWLNVFAKDVIAFSFVEKSN